MSANRQLDKPTQRIAVLASHSGTTLQALMDACTNKRINASVNLVISNNSTCGAMTRAAAARIPTLHASGKTHPEDACRDHAITNALKQADIDWVLLLGYMKKLGNQTLAAYDGQIINTHPALLPKFGGQGFFGRRVHEAVINSGETTSGATIHLVDRDYDSGKILAQASLAVALDDTAETLEKRVKTMEKELLIDTLINLFK